MGPQEFQKPTFTENNDLQNQQRYTRKLKPKVYTDKVILETFNTVTPNITMVYFFMGCNKI